MKSNDEGGEDDISGRRAPCGTGMLPNTRPWKYLLDLAAGRLVDAEVPAVAGDRFGVSRSWESAGEARAGDGIGLARKD